MIKFDKLLNWMSQRRQYFPLPAGGAEPFMPFPAGADSSMGDLEVGDTFSFGSGGFSAPHVGDVCSSGDEAL